MTRLTPFALHFCATGNGREPVRDFLCELETADRKKAGQDIRTLQFGWPVGMPMVKSLGQGLHELRTSLVSNRELRVFFAVEGNKLVLLHAIIKKDRKTPSHELEVARKRLKELRE